MTQHEKTDIIRTLLVEDDPVIVALHREYLAGLEGFELVAHAATVAEAVEALNRENPDLVLLDVRLPDGTGINLLRALRRARPESFDVIMITAVADRVHVESARRLGVVDYIVKPFSGHELIRRLTNYREGELRRRRSARASGTLTQREIDALRGVGGVVALPKGLSEATLALVEKALWQAPGRTATEISEQVGLSRVSARRYLEHLVALDVAEAQPRYGGTGRPSIEYAMVKKW